MINVAPVNACALSNLTKIKSCQHAVFLDELKGNFDQASLSFGPASIVFYGFVGL
jgi:hypothetical protein